VFNLSNLDITKEMEEVLGLGMKYFPVQRANKSQIGADIERLKIRIM
jgi:hypothetical protein